MKWFRIGSLWVNARFLNHTKVFIRFEDNEYTVFTRHSQSSFRQKFKFIRRNDAFDAAESWLRENLTTTNERSIITDGPLPF